MSTDLNSISKEGREHMDKAVEYLRNELKGVRTGRASPALVEYVKVDYYGSMTDLRQLAQVTVPEPTQLLIKPYDVSACQAIGKAIQGAGLGLNPQVEAKQVRLSIPPLSTERREQLTHSIKKMGEQAKVAVRNARRDANKHIDQAVKEKEAHISEDQAHDAKDEIDKITKGHEKTIDELIETKTKEVMES